MRKIRRLILWFDDLDFAWVFAGFFFAGALLAIFYSNQIGTIVGLSILPVKGFIMWWSGDIRAQNRKDG